MGSILLFLKSKMNVLIRSQLQTQALYMLCFVHIQSNIALRNIRHMNLIFKKYFIVAFSILLNCVCEHALRSEVILQGSDPSSTLQLLGIKSDLKTPTDPSIFF